MPGISGTLHSASGPVTYGYARAVRFGPRRLLATLVVTSQSFEHPSVGLTVRVDGDVAVAGKFEVESQHNFRY